MYEHADQSWRAQPRVMSDAVTTALAMRVGEYADEEKLTAVNVIFHGGEPLLAGAPRIVQTAQRIRGAVPPQTTLRFSLQTNGTLLDEAALAWLVDAGIWVSLSLDGGKTANDLHRLDHRGRSSFERTVRALELLERNREIYGGVISVVDPSVDPEDLFAFFGPRTPPGWDFLLPDAHYECRPRGRDADPTLYERWLLRAFDVWFDKYSTIPVRTFDAILAALAGLPSETDSFGFGEPDLLTIETDGTYHSLDVLKITASEATSLGLGLDRNPISEAAASPKLLAYRELLSFAGLSMSCQRCSEVGVCGGGAVPHRYSLDGFKNPSVYCAEMLGLIQHARNRVNATLASTATVGV